MQIVVQRIEGWWQRVCSEALRGAPKLCRGFATPQKSEVALKEGQMVLTATQLQAAWSSFRSNCAYFLAWCRVQESDSVPCSALGSSCLCLSSSGKLLFTSKGQQPFQPPSDAAVTKKEGRSESLVHWLMKHI